MAKATSTLSWCNVRLGDDHNWWVNETSDPVRWDVDGLSIIDPRQVDHIIELIDPLRQQGGLLRGGVVGAGILCQT